MRGVLAMAVAGEGSHFYRERAKEMRALADASQTEATRAAYLRLEASWLRLAEESEKVEKISDSEGDSPT